MQYRYRTSRQSTFRYFNQKQTKRGTYFLKFFACELLNFANVIGQIFFTDMFLGYQFQEFGRWVFAWARNMISAWVFGSLGRGVR